MSGCGEWLERLSAHLDDALTEAEREAVESHLAACAPCDEQLRSLRALKHAVARLKSREAPPGAVRAHVESLVFARPRPRWLVPALKAALAAGVVFGIAMLFNLAAYLTSGRPDDARGARLAQELAADHLHSVPEAMPAEIATGNPADIVGFFSGRVPFDPVAPRLPGTRLIGARLCKIEGRRVELLFYRHETDVTLSLFIADRDLGAAGGCREARGVGVCGRTFGGLTLHLVGAAPRERLERLLDEASY